MPRFLLLLTEVEHGARWDAADDAARERAMACYRAFSAAVAVRGAVVGGQVVAGPATARTVRPAPPGSERPVVAGPPVVGVEELGGFYVVEVPDLDVAVELAALLPPELTVEVRPCLDIEVT